MWYLFCHSKSIHSLLTQLKQSHSQFDNFAPQHRCHSVLNRSASPCLPPSPFLLVLITSLLLCLHPSPLFFLRHLFTEIENLGLMFKASVQLLGRPLDIYPPPFFPSPTPHLSNSSWIYLFILLSVASLWILLSFWCTAHPWPPLSYADELTEEEKKPHP